MNLLLIRKDTPQINYIIDNLAINTQYIIINPYDNYDKLIGKINNKCQNNIIQNIGFITLNDYTDNFYFCKFEKCILNSCEDYDPRLITWNPVLSLLMYLKTQYNCLTFDMLTCNIYNNNNWSYIIQEIYNKTNVQIRSSTNITGINGDWILESHNINLIGLYFKDDIINYSYNLDSNYSLNFIASKNKIKVSGNDSNGLIGFQNNIFKTCDLSNIIIKDFAMGQEYTVILSNNNKIYGCGLNDVGQLGDGTWINKYSLVEIDNTTINNSVINKIYSSQFSTYILTEDNNIFACGANYNGQLGIDSIYHQNIFTLVDTSMLNGAAIIKLSTGVSFFTILTNNNKLYSCGDNFFGQLGIQSNNNYITKLSEMNLINFTSNIYPIDIECGGNFIIVLSNDNNVYCCGNNNFGQLGTGNTINQNILTKININLNNSIPKELSCGYFHSCILTTDNNVYFSGYNAFGQFGNNTTTNSNIFIKTILNEYTPNKISCGDFHTIIQTTNNSLYSSGINTYGQLGIGNNNNQKIFTIIDSALLDISSNSVIKCGYDFTFILSDTLYSCGNNGYSNLINNDFTFFSDTKLFNTSTPVIKNIKNGKNFIVLITDDNKIYTAGINLYGQLGIGNTINSNILNNLNELSIAIFPSTYPIDIACGDEHFIVLMNNNKVYGCGRNNYGQLGQQDLTSIYKTLTLINTSFKIINIACGSYHSVFLTDNYQILSCGRNSEGQLGNQNYTNTNILTQNILTMLNTSKPQQISCGSYHTVILTDDFRIFACGRNIEGQLGDNTNNNSNIFKPIKNNMTPNKPIFISCGSYHTTVLTRQGKIYSCGLNTNGQLCNKTFNNSNELIEIDYNNFNNDKKLTSIFSNESNTFVIDETNQLYSCGLNNDGQLGLGITFNYVSNNLPINTSIIPSTIYAGQYNSYVLSNTKLYGSGRNYFNQLNNPDYTFLDSENLIEFNLNELTNISYIAAGNENIFIIDNNELFVCGKNTNGQFGNNSNSDAFELEKVYLPQPTINKPIKVFTFYEHTFVLAVNNKLYATGNNSYGQLGLGNNSNKFVFTEINNSFLSSSTISNISCGKNHSIILTNDGKIFSTGSNIYGQLGNGNNNNTNTFIQIDTSLLNGIPTKIACGAYHTLILTSNNKIYGCGLNNYGQLGNNTELNSNIFVEMSVGENTPSEIYGGYNFSLFLTTNNKIYGCGRNSEGQIDLTIEKTNILPKKIKTYLNDGEYITKLACGSYHFVILTSLNNLYSFGNNDFGQCAITKNKSFNQLYKCKIDRNYNNTNTDFLNDNISTLKNIIYVIFDIVKLINNFNLSLQKIFELVKIKDLILLGYSLQELKQDGVTIDIFINNGFTLTQLYDAEFTIQEILNTNKYSFFDLLENFTETELGDYKLIPYSNDQNSNEPNDYYIVIPQMDSDIKNDVILINRTIPTYNIIVNGIPFLSIKLYNESLNINIDEFSVIKSKPINIKIGDFKNIFYFNFRIYSVGITILNLIINKYIKKDIFNKFINEYENKYNKSFNSISFDKQISFYKEINNLNNIHNKKQLINSHEFDNVLKLTNPINKKYYFTSEIIYYSTVLEIGFKLLTDFIIYI